MADNWINISPEEAQRSINKPVAGWVDITPEEGNLAVSNQAQSLIGRFGKQLYNVFAQIPIGIAKTAARVAPGEIEQMIERRKALGIPTRKPRILPVPISPPETWAEKGIDWVAGIAGIVAQLALLKKALPVGTSTPAIWEVQNLMTGGTPGLGALFGATMGAAGKLGKTLSEKATAEGIALYVANRISGATPAEAAPMAFVPAVFRGSGALLQRIKGIKGIQQPEKLVETREALQKVAETKQRMLPARPTRPLLPKPPLQFAPPPKQLPMSYQERVARAPAQLYDDLMKKAETGDKSAIRKLNQYNQGLNLPSLEDLYARVNAGDVTAIEAIRQGNYRGGPNAPVAGFQEAAIKQFKLKPPREAVPRAEEPSYRKLIPKEETLLARRVPVTLERTPTEAVGAKIPAKPVSLALKTDFDVANERLLQQAASAKKLRKTEVKKALHELRVKQAKAGAAITERLLPKGAWDAIGKGEAGYKLKARNIQMEPLTLTSAEKEMYAKRILETFPTEDFKQKGARRSLLKLTEGRIPTNYEFREWLEPVLGPKVTQQLYDSLVPVQLSGWDIAKMTFNSFKFWRWGADIQGIRQLSYYQTIEPVAYGKTTKIGLKAYTSKEYFNRLAEDLEKDPGTIEAKKYGVGYYGTARYGQRPEWATPQLAQWLSQVGVKAKPFWKAITKPIRLVGERYLAAERATIAQVNAIQTMLWKQNTAWLKLKYENSSDLEKVLHNAAKTQNAFSKTVFAKNPTAAKIQNAANYFLFSTSYTISRPLRTVALVAYPEQRLQIATAMASNIAKYFLIGVLFETLGKATKGYFGSALNPLETDYGEGRVGNARFDIGGGDLQYHRTLARLIAASYIKYFGGGFPTKVGQWKVIEPSEVVYQYARSRVAPIFGVIEQIRTGRDFLGKEIPHPIRQTLLEQIPFLPDALEALATDGWPIALLAAGASFASVGVQAYEKNVWQQQREFEEQIAQTAYKQEWGKLTAPQQARLRVAPANRAQFEQFELQKKQERQLRPAVIALKEQRKAGNWIRKQQSKEHQAILTAAGVSTDISRSFGDWWLNDERYKRYRDLTAKYLAEELTKMESRPSWTFRRDNKAVDMAMNIARLKARIEVKRTAK